MSLFELPTRPETAADVTRWYWQKIESTSNDIKDFKSAQMLTYQVKPQGRRWFVPNKSYFEINYTLGPNLDSKGEAVADTPALRSDLQVSHLGAATMFQSAKVFIGGTLVSAVTNQLAQVQALKMRYERTKEFHDTIGQAMLSTLHRDPTGVATGYEPHHRKQGTLVWQPPIGFFDIAHGMPGLDIDITLQTDPNCVKNFLEPDYQISDMPDNDDELALGTRRMDANVSYSALRDAIGLTASFSEVKIAFYAAFAEGPRGDDRDFVLNIREWQCQPRTFRSGEFAQFSVRPETDTIAIALQDSRVNESILRPPSTRFNVRENYDDPDFVFDESATPHNLISAIPRQRMYGWYGGFKDTNRFTSMQVEYNGQLFPLIPERGNVIDSNDRSLMVRNAMNAGTFFSGYGSNETEEVIRANGVVYYFQTPKDGTSYATSVGVNGYHEAFDGDPDFSPNLLLFACHNKAYQIRTSDSMVVVVNSADVTRSDFGLSQAGSGSRHF